MRLHLLQTQKEFASALGVTHQTIFKRLHALGRIQNQGIWVTFELKPTDVECRLLPNP